MITVNLRRYSEPDKLREISPRTLIALMDDPREFLAGKGVELPPVVMKIELDYRAMTTVFLSPDDIPVELVEKFHTVEQMKQLTPQQDLFASRFNFFDRMPGPAFTSTTGCCLTFTRGKFTKRR